MKPVGVGSGVEMEVCFVGLGVVYQAKPSLTLPKSERGLGFSGG